MRHRLGPRVAAALTVGSLVVSTPVAVASLAGGYDLAFVRGPAPGNTLWGRLFG